MTQPTFLSGGAQRPCIANCLGGGTVIGNARSTHGTKPMAKARCGSPPPKRRQRSVRDLTISTGRGRSTRHAINRQVFFVFYYPPAPSWCDRDHQSRRSLMSYSARNTTFPPNSVLHPDNDCRRKSAIFGSSDDQRTLAKYFFEGASTLPTGALGVALYGRVERFDLIHCSRFIHR